MTHVNEAVHPKGKYHRSIICFYGITWNLSPYLLSLLLFIPLEKPFGAPNGISFGIWKEKSH
jgi:hypothetical protein